MQLIKHVFILAQNSSGSSILYWTLGDCKKATRFTKEGPAYALEYMPNHRKIGNLDLFSEKKDILSDAERFNWKKIKENWEKIWDKTKPIKVEKSTPSIFYANMYNDNFQNPHFIILTRSPYAVCEAIKRRSKNFSMERIAKHWGECIKKQFENLNNLNSIHVKYEDLCNGDYTKIINFIPELCDFRTNNWISRNEKANRLSDANVSIIKKTLYNYKDYIKKFGYEI